ncbi:ground-like domain-containing protein [Ditylenchus destructor]|nr:ground-like domain-containing protein [Ditylenchus destructor]
MNRLSNGGASAPAESSSKSGGYRRRALGSKTANLDSKCNNEELKKILDENIAESTSNSKRAVAKAARKHFNTTFDVVCSSGDFSYLVNTRIFCEHKVNDITCFAFEH